MTQLHRTFINGSPHKQFGQAFGLAQQDLDTITSWLHAHGFTVNTVYPSGMLIDFSGTADQVTRGLPYRDTLSRW